MTLFSHDNIERLVTMGHEATQGFMMPNVLVLELSEVLCQLEDAGELTRYEETMRHLCPQMHPSGESGGLWVLYASRDEVLAELRRLADETGCEAYRTMVRKRMELRIRLALALKKSNDYQAALLALAESELPEGWDKEER